jgi:hypothetical protein
MSTEPVLILKIVKVVCFDTLLQVLILKILGVNIIPHKLPLCGGSGPKPRNSIGQTPLGDTYEEGTVCQR